MSYKESLKSFFIRFKRVIIASGLCVLAMAIIGVVAYKSTNQVTINKNEMVQTSAPTSVSFIMPIIIFLMVLLLTFIKLNGYIIIG